MIKNIQI